MNQDVVIVGAPRSGTNMLRDVLTRLDGVSTWPCDEINLLWRHGNRREPSDELSPAMARPEVRSYLRSRFEQIRHRYDAHTVVEKTCATSLRVGFTREVLPHAKYLFITRDGVDAAASAMDRWHAQLDLRYTAAKVRFVPVGDLPYYGMKFVTNQIRRRRPVAPQSHLKTWWGPRPVDYQKLMRRHPLDEACMLQWVRCVDASQRDLDGLLTDQLLHVSYERFVADPAQEMTRVVDFVGVDARHVDRLVGDVSNSSVGKGRAKLGTTAVSRLEAIAGETLRGLGYAS